MRLLKQLTGYVAVWLTAMATPAVAEVSGSFESEYRNSRAGISDREFVPLPTGGSVSRSVAEAAAAGTVSAGRAQVTSSLSIPAVGPPEGLRQFLDSIGTTFVTHNMVVTGAPVSAGFLEVAFAYESNIQSQLIRGPGSIGSGESISDLTYFMRSQVSVFNHGYGELTYENRNGFLFPVFTFVPGYTSFNAESRHDLFEAAGTFYHPDEIIRRTMARSGFANGQVMRLPFLTGRNMAISMTASCQVRGQDHHEVPKAGTCEHNFGWGGLLGAVDLDGNAISLDQITLQGNIPFQGDVTPIGFDPYANLSGVSFTPIAFGAAVPEPVTWAMLVIGFGLIGAARRSATTHLGRQSDGSNVPT